MLSLAALRTLFSLSALWLTHSRFRSLSRVLGLALAVLLVSSRQPLTYSQDVQDPIAINEMFDSISYNKGGSLLLMVRDVIGPQVFQSGECVS